MSASWGNAALGNKSALNALARASNGPAAAAAAAAPPSSAAAAPSSAAVNAGAAAAPSPSGTPTPLRRTISRNVGVPENASSFRNVQQGSPDWIKIWDKTILGKMQTVLDRNSNVTNIGKGRKTVSITYSGGIAWDGRPAKCWFLYGGSAYRKIHDFVEADRTVYLQDVAPRSNDYDIAILTTREQQPALEAELRTFLDRDLLPSLVRELGSDYWDKSHMSFDGREIQFTMFEEDNMYFHIDRVEIGPLVQLRVKVKFNIIEESGVHEKTEYILDLNIYGQNADDSIDSVGGVYGGKVPELLKTIASPLPPIRPDTQEVFDTRRYQLGYDGYQVILPPFSQLLKLSMDGMEKRVGDYKCKQDYARMNALFIELKSDYWTAFNRSSQKPDSAPGLFVREMEHIRSIEDKFLTETADGASLAVCRVGLGRAAGGAAPAPPRRRSRRGLKKNRRSRKVRR